MLGQNTPYTENVQWLSRYCNLLKYFEMFTAHVVAALQLMEQLGKEEASAFLVVKRSQVQP